MRILLIEDSERLRGAVARGLRKEGYAVDEAKDGKEGLWMVSENPYDVVVLDLGLPQIDGLTVLRRMREKDVRSHVLILSARDQVEDRVQGPDPRGRRLPHQTLLLRRIDRSHPRPPAAQLQRQESDPQSRRSRPDDRHAARHGGGA